MRARCGASIGGLLCGGSISNIVATSGAYADDDTIFPPGYDNMKYLVLIAAVFCAMYMPACMRDNPTDPGLLILYERFWNGTLDGRRFELVLYDAGEIGIHAFGGNAVILRDTIVLFYTITNGRQTSENGLSFQLKEMDARFNDTRYFLAGSIHRDSISGTFTEFDSESHLARIGTWSVH